MVFHRASLALALSFGAAVASPSCTSTVDNVQTAIPNDEVEKHMNFARTGDSIPSMLHGVFWMDQSGYYQTRPDRPDQNDKYETVPGQDLWFRTFPHNLKQAAPELLVSFGDSWNETTKCAKISPHTDHWTYANTTGASAYGSIDFMTSGSGFFQFCIDNDTVSILWQTCAYGEDIPVELYQDSGRRMIRKDWGFERVNLAYQLAKEQKDMKIAERYAVYQIIDGDGKRTPHYQAYSDFMKMQCWFTPGVNSKLAPHMNDSECTSQGGWLINLGDGTQVIGKPLQAVDVGAFMQKGSVIQAGPALSALLALPSYLVRSPALVALGVAALLAAGGLLWMVLPRAWHPCGTVPGYAASTGETFEGSSTPCLE